MTAATSLLDFILNLLKDPQAQAEFRASPEHVLAANGLTGVRAADIHETLPLVTDSRFVELSGRSHAFPPPAGPAPGDGGTHAAIQYLHHITRTYRYDDHGAHGHDLGHVNIWAVGDVPQAFDDSHVAAGGAVPGAGTPGPGGGPATGNWVSHGQGAGLHSFGAGAATTWAAGAGSQGAHVGDTIGSHDSAGFRYADYGGAASPAGPDDYHTHDVHGSLGDSYSGQDSYYGQDAEHSIHDPPEPHIYLDLH